MKQKKWLAAGLAAGVLFALFIYPGAMRPIDSHFAGTCRALPLEAGAGDIAIDAERGLAYIAYLDRSPNPEGKAPRGTIMLVDLNAAQPRVRAALVTDPPDFRPVALSLFVPAQGTRRLFVVNAGVSSPAIHILEQSTTGAFALIKTVSDPLLDSPTAIVATGPEQFYATNDAALFDASKSSRLARAWQLLLPPSASSVVFYDGQRSAAAATGLKMAAGIDTSPDHEVIYVAELAAKRLQLFTRDSTTGVLTPTDRVTLPSRPEHLHTDAVGNIWIASHPKWTAALKSVEGSPTRTPTEVLRFAPKATGAVRVSSIYRNDGAEVSGATSAALYRSRLVLGSWIDHKLLLCDRSQ